LLSITANSFVTVTTKTLLKLDYGTLTRNSMLIHKWPCGSHIWSQILAGAKKKTGIKPS